MTTSSLWLKVQHQAIDDKQVPISTNKSPAESQLVMNQLFFLWVASLENAQAGTFMSHVENKGRDGGQAS